VAGAAVVDLVGFSVASCLLAKTGRHVASRPTYATTFVKLNPKAKPAPLSVYARNPREKGKSRNLPIMRLNRRHHFRQIIAGNSLSLLFAVRLTALGLEKS
jgi:hypothetical protein